MTGVQTCALPIYAGSRLPYYTHSKLREIPWLNQFMPEPVVRLHPQDARDRNIGAGDIPDNLLPFYEALQEKQIDLSAVHFGAVGIGSREYDTFCGAIDKLESALKACGAKQIGETLKINVLEHEIPEDPAEVWLGSWQKLL